MSKNKVNKAVSELDKYLDSLSYSYIISQRTDRLYEKLFHDIAVIVLKFYSDLDVTANIELSIATDTSGRTVRTIVTGYIRVSKERYLQIEKVYLPKEYQSE